MNPLHHLASLLTVLGDILDWYVVITAEMLRGPVTLTQQNTEAM